MNFLFLESSDLAGVQPDAIPVVATMDNGNKRTQPIDDNSDKIKKPKTIKTKTAAVGSAMLTAADMYEPGFRIENAGLCSSRTRLLVLITSAAEPSHSLNRQAIRMTWMNRYGPRVSMAFLVGTPQMTETDPVGQMLEAEERALRIRLNGIDMNNDIDPKEKSKPPADPPVSGNFGWSQFSRDRELDVGEGLDDRAMQGLNIAERAVQRVLGREHGRYGDMIQCRVRDVYTNLTLKSIAALEWTRQYCAGARYLLKTDDDMFIDVHRLLRFIDRVETEAVKTEPTATADNELPPTIWGRLAHGWRPIRQHNSKYYVSRAQYAGRVYPDFCTGPAYLMTRSAVIPLYEAALGRDFDVDDDGGGNRTSAAADTTTKNTVPYLKLEDVYLTGVVAERLTRRAAERLARLSAKGKDEKVVPSGNRTDGARKPAAAAAEDGGRSSKRSDAIIVKIRRVHDDQFANKKIVGRALDKALCSGVSPDNAAVSGTNGWFRWYWGDAGVTKNPTKKKKTTDQGVISVHMVKYFEQFDLWRRLMDGRTKCKP